MIGYVISLLGIIVSVIFTILVSRHYYKRTVDKSLTPFYQFSSTPFKGLDPNVRKLLEIKYKGKEIQQLFEIQFLIANTGDKAIRDIITPLKLEIPKETSILDETILHIHPSGRDIQSRVEGNTIIFDFPLLNSNDFFIFKMLLDKELSPKNLVFTITADELPPKLICPPLPYESLQTKDHKRKRFEVPMFITGIIFLFMLSPLIKVLYDSIKDLPVFEFSIEFLKALGPHDWAVILSCLPVIIILLIGIMLLLISFEDVKLFRNKNIFIVPNERQLLRIRPPFSYMDTIGDKEKSDNLPKPKSKKKSYPVKK